MISKVVIGRTFYGTCRYVCMDEKRAVVLEAEGVRGYDYKLMATDFEMQHALRSSLGKAVFHGIISFYPGEKLQDAVMAEIAKEYLKKLGITNTQYAITKHTDKNHSHLHIIANLVNNKGETIKDNWIGLKGKKIAQELTLNYGLKEATSKNLLLTNLEALNEKEANRYVIYQAILQVLPQSKSLEDLKDLLVKKKIQTLYKFKGQTNVLQGISFKIGNYKYKGSEIDRNFSIKNLEKTINEQQIAKSLKEPFASTILQPSIDIRSGIGKQKNRSENLLEQLIKPEQIHEPLLSQWKLEKKKKKSRGYHL